MTTISVLIKLFRLRLMRRYCRYCLFRCRFREYSSYFVCIYIIYLFKKKKQGLSRFLDISCMRFTHELQLSSKRISSFFKCFQMNTLEYFSSFISWIFDDLQNISLKKLIKWEILKTLCLWTLRMLKLWYNPEAHKKIQKSKQTFYMNKHFNSTTFP